jgi:CubicO group peptidase (beta-lactamase class C family)
VTTHLPGFQLFDPYVTREMTVRDLLSHRSGLARGDRLWYGTENDREDIVRLVRHLEPTWSFRSQFGYQNIMYLTAGEVVEAITGRDWDAVVDERIFEPLGMSETVTSIVPLTGKTNVATPHGKVDERVQPIRWRNIDNIAPAGSINSNVVEMAQWVRLQLNEGKHAGRQVVSERSVREMHSPHTIIPTDTAAERLYPETHFRSYGLGWFLEDYRGRKLVHHGGNIDGMSALVAMMPEEDVGLVILTNMNGTALPGALMRRIFDLYLGGPGRDWSTEVLALTKERQARAAEQQRKTLEARVQGTTPSLALESYTGVFEDPMYGRVTVTFEKGSLVLNAGPAFVADLEHWHYNTFRAIWRDRFLGRGFVTYQLNPQGKAETLDVDGLAEFRRVPEPAPKANGR